MNSTKLLEIQVYSSFADAEAFRHRWDQLALDNPFVGWDWLSNWWKSFGTSNLVETKELALAVVTDSSGQLKGIAPFYVRSKLSGRSLRFLGDGKASSDYARFLAEQDSIGDVAHTLADWITSRKFASRFGSLDLIEMEGVKASQTEIELFQRNMMVRGWKFHQQAIESAWKMSLEPDWKSLLGRMCTSQKRKANKIAKQLEAGAFVGEVIKNPDEFEEAWKDFVRLHQKRRRELGQPGCFHDPVFERFLKQSTREMMVKQQASLIFAKHKDHRIAAALYFNNQDTLFLYQSGIDSAFDHLEPGHLSNGFIIQWGVQQGYRALDFLRGDEHYKKRWGGVPCSLFRSRLISPKWSSRMRETMWQAARGFKRRSRSFLEMMRKQESSELRQVKSEVEVPHVSD